MNKLRTLLPVALIMTITFFSSCEYDDAALKRRLKRIENALGTNEPLKVDFSTTNYNDDVIAKEGSFLFKALYVNESREAIYDYGDGEYYINIVRGSDIEFSEYGNLGFYYNSETREVTDAWVELQFAHPLDTYVNTEFYDGNDANSLEIEVLSFDPETGNISINVTASSEEGFGGNAYEGHEMTLNMSFKGKLRIFNGLD